MSRSAPELSSFSQEAFQSILLSLLLFPCWGGRGSMRNDLRYLHISLGFSALSACPVSFKITSSAFSPICLLNKFWCSNSNPITWFRKGSNYHVKKKKHDWECEKEFPFHKIWIWNISSSITSLHMLRACLKARMQRKMLLFLQIHLFNLWASSSGNILSSSPHIISVGCIKKKA